MITANSAAMAKCFVLPVNGVDNHHHQMVRIDVAERQFHRPAIPPML